jgi:hypothetical protein
MASNGSERSGLLSAGGVLSIMAGVFQISSGVSIAVNVLVPNWRSLMLADLLLLPFFPQAWRLEILWPFPVPCILTYTVQGWWMIIGGCVSVLGILAVVGGISAIRRKRFGLSLAGAICALPSGILGILAVIFVALGKREFGADN